VTLGGQSNRTVVRRNPSGGRYDSDTIYAIFDEARFCHIGFMLDGAPAVLPSIHDRVDDVLYIHGSRSNRMLRCMTDPVGACITATLFDGLVLARSVFNHTMNYRSAVAFGHPMLIEDPTEKLDALHHLVDHVLPGRSGEARSPNDRELTLTSVLRMPIEEASAKVDDGPPEDEPEDLGLDVWAGQVPARVVWGEPIMDRLGTVDRAPEPPASVRRLLGG
jgi:uncharacterized protein